MDLDERLRDELRHAVEPGQLREDDALDDVRATHRRGLVRERVTRQTIAVAVVVSLFASVAIIVSWRNAPDHAGVAAGSDRFSSTVTIRVALTAPSLSTSTTTSRTFKLADPRTLALAPSTRRAALLSVQLSLDDPSVDFRAALNPTRDLLSLTVTAPSARESTAVTREWASAFAKAERAEAIQLLDLRNRALDRRITVLHQHLETIDAELIRIDPATFKGRLGFPGHHHMTDPATPPLHVPEAGSVHELNLANERIQILSQLADAGADAARNQISLGGPPISQNLAQTRAVRVETSSPPTVPLLVSWAIGLVVVLAGAFFLYRRRTRATRQVAE